MSHYAQKLLRHRTKRSENTTYMQNAIVHWVLIAVGFVMLANVALLFFFISPSEALLKLQYNVYFGASVQGKWWSGYVLPGMGLLFLLIDIVLGVVLYHIKERIAAYIILLGGLFAHIALTVAVISIILNNQ